MDDQKSAKPMITNGHVLYVDRESVYLCRGLAVLRSADSGKSWEKIYSIPAVSLAEMAGSVRLGRRLFRSSVHHFLPGRDEYDIIVAHRKIFVGLRNAQSVKFLADLPGSRPLVVIRRGDWIYFGEYRGNAERSPISIWRCNCSSGVLEKVWTFSDVRHIHGVQEDPYTGYIWVTTGDSDDESALWMTDDEFRSLKRIAGGSQDFRAIKLVFTRDHVYFGSDDPFGNNSISRLHKDSAEHEQLADITGPVFHGCSVAGARFFSTAVEPGMADQSNLAEVWGALTGKDWIRLAAYRKDFWSMKYFQYGQVIFPAGPGDDKYLWLTPFATLRDHQTIRVPLDSIRSYLESPYAKSKPNFLE